MDDIEQQEPERLKNPKRQEAGRRAAEARKLKQAELLARQEQLLEQLEKNKADIRIYPSPINPEPTAPSSSNPQNGHSDRSTMTLVFVVGVGLLSLAAMRHGTVPAIVPSVPPAVVSSVPPAVVPAAQPPVATLSTKI